MNKWIPGIIMLVIGIAVLTLPDLIRWVLGTGIIVMGVLSLVKHR